MAALGVVILVLGVLSAFALVDLVHDSTLAGSIDVSLLGVSFGTRSAEEIMMAAVGLAVVATALILGGSVALLAGRRRRRSKQMEEKRVLVSRLETTARLLEHRVELLLAQVQELEERKVPIGGELKSERTAPTQVDDVVVLPDVPPPPPEPDSPEQVERSRLDEGLRQLRRLSPPAQKPGS